VDRSLNPNQEKSFLFEDKGKEWPPEGERAPGERGGEKVENDHVKSAIGTRSRAMILKKGKRSG